MSVDLPLPAKGTVRSFNPKSGFGIIETANGTTLKMDARDARSVFAGEGAMRFSPGLQRPPIPGEEVLYSASANGKQAKHWVFAVEHERAKAKSRPSISLEQLQEVLGKVPRLVYTDTTHNMGLAIVTTYVRWTIGYHEVARGVFKDDIFKANVVNYFGDGTFRPTEMKGDAATACRGFGPLEKEGVKVIALWNGGYRDYVVDPQTVRDETPEETARADCFPEFGGWARCRFLRGQGEWNENQVVKILLSLCAGD